MALLKDKQYSENDMLNFCGKNEAERKKLQDDNKVIKAECKALREENSQLKIAKTSLEKRLELLDQELESAVSERADIK